MKIEMLLDRLVRAYENDVELKRRSYEFNKMVLECTGKIMITLIVSVTIYLVIKNGTH